MLTRRIFVAAAATAPLSAQPATGRGLGNFLNTLASQSDNILFTEPHIGGMFFSSYQFAGRSEGLFQLLGGSDLKHTVLELPPALPGANLQKAVDALSQPESRAQLAHYMFARARLQPLYLGMKGEPALEAIPAEERQRRFSEGILDCIGAASGSGRSIHLIDYFAPEKAAFLQNPENIAKLNKGDLKVSREYARIRLNDTYQAACLQARTGDLKKITGIIGWQHAVRIIDVPGLPDLLSGRTTVVEMFADRFNESETLRLTALIGQPQRRGAYKFYFTTGEIVETASNQTIGHFRPFDGLQAAPDPAAAISLAPR